MKLTYGVPTSLNATVYHSSTNEVSKDDDANMQNILKAIGYDEQTPVHPSPNEINAFSQAVQNILGNMECYGPRDDDPLVMVFKTIAMCDDHGSF